MRWLISFLAAGLAVIVQVTIVDRIAFPGGTGPDLVLLAVVALALAGGPLLGSLLGFAAGLGLDVAPPGSHFVGQDALVFCLIGYLCGLAAERPPAEGVPEEGHTALFEIVVTAAGAVCGEAMGALLGVMLSDPRVTWSAIKHVLPVAAGYDVVLAPFALYTAAALLRLAGARRESRRAALPAASAIAAAAQGALRPAPRREPDLKLGNLRGQSAALRPSPRSAPMREPDLKLGNLRGQSAALRSSPRSAPRREPDLKLGNLRGSSGALRPAPRSAPMREPNLKLGSLHAQNVARKPRPRREPNLRLGRGGPLGGGALGAAFAGQGAGASGAFGGPARVRFSSRSQGGVLGGSLLGGSAPGSLGGSFRMRSSRFGSSRLGRSLLGGSVFSGSSSALGRPAALSRPAQRGGRPAFLGRPALGSSWIGHSSGLGRSSSPTPALHLGRPSSRHRALTRLTAALRGPGRTKLPKSAVSRRSLGRSALGSPARPKRPARGWLRRSAPHRGGLSGGGLGRSTPRLRMGSTRSGLPRRSQSQPRLRMPRARMKRSKSWRKGGYR